MQKTMKDFIQLFTNFFINIYLPRLKKHKKEQEKD